jgi:uncharacterized membrane-anchored protein
MECNKKDVLAKLIKLDDGYHVLDADGSIGPICDKVTRDGYLVLSPNSANRKNINKKNIDRYFAENPNGYINFTYKKTRVLGPAKDRLPNAKLIAYLSQEEQEEYKAIIARAYQAKETAKHQPKTELEKARHKAEKAVAAYHKLLAQFKNMK